MQFLGNFSKIVCWRPPSPRELAPLPWGNPGSATEVCLTYCGNFCLNHVFCLMANDYRFWGWANGLFMPTIQIQSDIFMCSVNYCNSYIFKAWTVTITFQEWENLLTFKFKILFTSARSARNWREFLTRKTRPAVIIPQTAQKMFSRFILSNSNVFTLCSFWMHWSVHCSSLFSRQPHKRASFCRNVKYTQK